MKKLQAALAAAILSTSIPAFADLADDLADLVGWQIVYAGTVTGYVEENGKRNDSFEGCEYGRKIILNDSKTVTCRSYSYSYSYRPKAVVLTNGSAMKLIVKDKALDVMK